MDKHEERNAVDGKDNTRNPVTPAAEAHGALGWGGEIGGVLLLILGIIFMVGGWQLGLGVPTRLGTGAFPFVSGALLAVLAVVICIEERRGDGIDTGNRFATPGWRGWPG